MIHSGTVLMACPPSLTGAGMPRDLDLRRLRYFVAAAERLHFTQAAQQLHVAQQAISREIQALERDTGAVLFDRSTRRVRLTPAGAILLERARDLLALHDALLEEVHGAQAPLLADIVAEQLTPHLLVRAARERHGAEIVTRTGGGLGASLPQLASGAIGVAFGHLDPARLPAGTAQRPVRTEPLGLLVPAGHPLAAEESVPAARLRGMTIDVSAGNPNAPEWTELGSAFLASCGAQPSPAHHHVVGAEETALHLAAYGIPILAHTTSAPIAGAVLVRLTGPEPAYTWRMLWRRPLRHPALSALHDTIDQLAATHSWGQAGKHS
jgi:DNA-binding transcriptional LysR family regulator